MRRIALIVALAALAAPAAASAAAPEPPAGDDAPAVPVLGAKLTTCDTGLLPGQRAAEFSGAMPAVAGATGLAMRFELEQRKGATGAWKPLSAPSFGRYERAMPGAAGFVYSKRVERLAVGASYRVSVRFRWTASDGSVVKRAVRRSTACRQTDLRPDAAVLDATTGTPSADGRSHYVVRVQNTGLGPLLEPLRVSLAVDGAPLAPQTVTTLLPGANASVGFDGPACTPGGSITAAADPQDAVDEPDEADDVLTVACP